MSNDFLKISDVLKESVFTSKGYGQALDKCMLFCFWKKVAGKKFEKLAIPYDLKGDVLFVSVATPVIAQELTFFKADLIKNYTPYANGLNLKVNDIHFNYKNWASVKNDGKSTAFDEDFYEDYKQEDYDSIQLDEFEQADFDLLKQNIDAIKFFPSSLKERMYNNILKQHKAQKLRNLSNKNE